MSVTFHTLRGADFPEKFKILMFRLTWEPGPEPKRFMQILIYKCYIGHCWMPLIVISDVRYWRTKTECWNKIQGDLPSCQISCLLGTRSINSLPLHWTSRCGRSPTLCLIPSLSVPPHPGIFLAAVCEALFYNDCCFHSQAHMHNFASLGMQYATWHHKISGVCSLTHLHSPHWQLLTLYVQQFALLHLVHMRVNQFNVHRLTHLKHCYASMSYLHLWVKVICVKC